VVRCCCCSLGGSDVIKGLVAFVCLLQLCCRSLVIDQPCTVHPFNPLTPNDNYSGRTAPLTSKHCILYIYSTIIGTEYFKHGIYFPFLSLQNAVCFIILTYLVPVLFTIYIQSVLKFKKNISSAKRLIMLRKMSPTSTPRPTTTLCYWLASCSVPLPLVICGLYILATKLTVVLFMDFDTLKMKATYFFEMTGTSIVFQKTRIQGNRSLQYTDLCYVCDAQ